MVYLPQLVDVISIIVAVRAVVFCLQLLGFSFKSVS